MICLTTLRRQLTVWCVRSSLFCHCCWLCVLTYLNPSCHLLFFFFFLQCMRREYPQLSFLIATVHICVTNYQHCPHCLSHANILHRPVFSVQSATARATMPFNLQLADPADLLRNTVIGADWWDAQVTRILRAPSHSVSLPPRASCLNPFAETRQGLGRVHSNMEVPALQII